MIPRGIPHSTAGRGGGLLVPFRFHRCPPSSKASIWLFALSFSTTRARAKCSRQSLLRFFQVNRAVAGVDGQQVSAAVNFSVDVFVAHAAFDGDRHFEVDVTVVGTKVHIGGKTLRDLKRYAAVAGVNVPTGRHG